MTTNSTQVGSVWRAVSIALLGLSVGVVGCGFNPLTQGKKVEAPGTEGTKPPAVVIPVEAALATHGPISEYFQTYSRVEAETSVDVTSQGTGECIALLVDEGDDVTQGQVLAELKKDEAIASLSESQIQLKESEAAYERSKNLKERGLISQIDYDATYFAFERAKETVTMRQEAVQKLTIKAPWSGIITKRNIQPGMLVSSGTVAFSLVDTSSFALAIQVPERILPDMRAGQTAEVSIDSLADQMLVASVRRINPSVDPETGKVKVMLDFAKDTQELLREAAFARVKLVMDTRENALLIPKDCVLEENTRKFVFVVREAEVEAGEELKVAEAEAKEKETEDAPTKDGEVLASPVEPETSEEPEIPLTVERVDVTIGLEDSEHVEIISGLTETDLVVTNGHHHLATVRENTRVKVTNATAEIMEKAGITADEALAEAEKNKKETAPRNRWDGHGD